MVLVSLTILVVLGPAQAVTVRVQTSSGASTSATYYTQDGDWATGDAAIASTGAIEHNTSGSIKMGLVRAESGGDRAFTPFTGDFSATANAGAGGDASSTATSANARVDIFVVTQAVNSTLDNYAGAAYGTINAAVTAAEGEGAPGLPDWILVDQGNYNEGMELNSFEVNSALTSVWGGPDTVIEGTGAGDDAIEVNDSAGFRIEGFTVRDSEDDGIEVEDSDDAQIICNIITNAAESGIEVNDSDRVEVGNNRVTDSDDEGILVEDSDDARILNNTVINSSLAGILVEDSDGVQVTGNTSWRNHENGLSVQDSANVRITRNNILNNGSAFGGITLSGAATTVSAFSRNNIEGNHNWGLLNSTPNAINATNNWWGDASGPSGEGPGTGDAIQNSGGGSVTFTPWATTPFALP